MTATAAEGLRVEEVMLRRPRPETGRCGSIPRGGLVGLEVCGILGRDGLFDFTLQARGKENKKTLTGSKLALHSQQYAQCLKAASVYFFSPFISESLY